MLSPQAGFTLWLPLTDELEHEQKLPFPDGLRKHVKSLLSLHPKEDGRVGWGQMAEGWTSQGCGEPSVSFLEKAQDCEINLIFREPMHHEFSLSRSQMACVARKLCSRQGAASQAVSDSSSPQGAPQPCTGTPVPLYLAKLSLEGLGDLLPLSIASLREHVDDGLLVGP